ncbi:MAG: hypothetical protein H0U95_09035 [Bacteroidetes bacterium]|nr:hypothetical protein [Bacteroidota bacterium]
MATLDLQRNKALSENRQFHRNNSNDSIHKICIKNGILTAILLISSFLSLCAITHRLEINQLTVPNLFLLLFGVYFALENYSPNGKSGSIDYFEGFKVGLYTSLVAVGIHALVVCAYCIFDTQILGQSCLFHLHLNPFTIAGVLMFEGLAAGLIITFSLMQYFKKPDTPNTNS